MLDAVHAVIALSSLISMLALIGFTNIAYTDHALLEKFPVLRTRLIRGTLFMGVVGFGLSTAVFATGHVDDWPVAISLASVAMFFVCTSRIHRRFGPAS